MKPLVLLSLTTKFLICLHIKYCIIHRRLGIIIRGYKDSLEIHIESNVNRFRTQNFDVDYIFGFV